MNSTSPRAHILVVDDEEDILEFLSYNLEKEGAKVYTAKNGLLAIEVALNKKPDLILLDVMMPEMDGMEVLDGLLAENIDSPVIMISGHGNIETAVQAIKKGAFDFIEKPLDLNRILVTIRNAKDKTVLIEEKKVLKKTVKSFKGSSIIGETEGIILIKEMIEKVAPSDARVLVTGENGTGKELVARGVHEKSLRGKKLLHFFHFFSNPS